MLDPLIPVGRIISQIYTQNLPNEIPFDELYEDAAPHGRANTYFLAGLITYMALYEQEVLGSYMPSTIVHPDIRNNLNAINNFIWQELNDFNFPNGDSRVFYSEVLSTNQLQTSKALRIFSNPANDSFVIDLNTDENYAVSILNITGAVIKNFDLVLDASNIDVSDLESGIYFVKISGLKDGVNYIKKLIKE